MFSHLKNEARQKESGRRLFACTAFGVLAIVICGLPARAEGGLDTGGLTFKDFATADNGASFNRGDPMLSSRPEPTAARIVAIDAANGLAKVYFDSVRVEASLPLGWQATEDGERGVGFSADRATRVLIWRVDFAYEGVRDADHYAATKVGAIKARKPGVRAEARKLSDGSFLIAYDNVPPSRGDTGPRTVFDLVMSKPGNPKEGVLMTLGLPGGDDDRGLKLMALLKSKMIIIW
jgi:hypothetical protein